MVFLDIQENLDIQDNQVIQVLMDNQDIQDIQVLMDNQDIQVTMVCLDSLVLVFLDIREFQVIQE
jgi:hypothetical protein